MCLKRKALILGLALLWAVPAFAQIETHFVRDGGTCTNHCHDWTDAYDQVTTVLSAGDLERGDTIYVARNAGSYSGFTFSLETSTTTLVTIKAATSGDHGSETGWNALYGTGVATFGGVTIAKGYLTIDGQEGGGPTDWECANCGFKFEVAQESGSTIFEVNDDFDCCDSVVTSNITIRHADLDANSTGIELNGVATRAFHLASGQDMLLEYLYIHDIGCDMFTMIDADDNTVQYSKLARNHQGSATGGDPGSSDDDDCHGDLFEGLTIDYGNQIFRYNFVEDAVGSYAFGAHGTGIVISGIEIYGNIFYWTIEPVFGNGFIGTIGDGTITGLKVYNNTFAGLMTTAVIGCCGGEGGVTGEMRNNLFWQTTGATYNASLGGGTSTNNTCYTGSTACEEDLSGDPFTSVAGRDFSLVDPSTAGTTLASPYDTDMNGCVRGDDATWDRGALEYNAVACNSGPVKPIHAPSHRRQIRTRGDDD